MNISNQKKEEFLGGFLIPTIIVFGTWLIHAFDFLYYFFPPALIIGFVTVLFFRKWNAVLGMIFFVILSFLLRSILPIFWSWIMADNELVKRIFLK